MINPVFKIARKEVLGLFSRFSDNKFITEILENSLIAREKVCLLF